MNDTDCQQWHRTSPFAAIFYLGKIYQAIARNMVQILAPLIALSYAAEGNLVSKIIFGGGTLVVVTVIAAFVRYWFFRYHISSDSILIREGVIKKTQLDIKFERIQAINTQQNFIFRFFDLVTVKFDTAGSAKQEGNLPAIKSALANSLKETIRREAPAKAPQSAADETTDCQSPEPRTILQLGAKDMVRIGLSSNRALIFLAFLAPLMQTIDENIEETIEDNAVASAIEASQLSLSSGIGIALMIVVGVLVFLMIASITGAFLRYHGFTLVTDSDVFRSSGGLLTRHEHSINFRKIQTVHVTQNPVLRLFNRVRLGAKQASSGRRDAGKTFVIPLSEASQLPTISTEIFGDEFRDVDLNPRMDGYLKVSPRYVRSRMLLTGILPALLGTGLLSLGAGFYAAVLLTWIPLNGLLVWMKYRRLGFRVTGDGIQLRRGFIGYQVTAFTHRKVQRVSITQSIPQKRRGLATLRIYLASGSVKLPFIDFELARQVRDYMLYEVESSELAWH